MKIWGIPRKKGNYKRKNFKKLLNQSNDLNKHSMDDGDYRKMADWKWQENRKVTI